MRRVRLIGWMASGSAMLLPAIACANSTETADRSATYRLHAGQVHLLLRHAVAVSAIESPQAAVIPTAPMATEPALQDRLDALLEIQPALHFVFNQPLPEAGRERITLGVRFAQTF